MFMRGTLRGVLRRAAGSDVRGGEAMKHTFLESIAMPLFCAFIAGFCTCLLALENERRQVAETARQVAATPPVIVTDCRTMPGEIVFVTE